MRFDILSASVATVLVVACSSEPTTSGAASRADAQRTAASAASPCAGKQPGDTCTLCDPSDAACAETTDLKTCGASGDCTSQSAPAPIPYQPCASKTTGDACTLCDPSVAGCVETMDLKACDASGTCTSQFSPPPYDACSGKKTGDACTLCAPNDAGCVETAVLKACDPGGGCR